MTSIYGHKWSSQYGDCDADDTWGIGLKGITPQQLAHGLRHCIALSADRVKVGDEDWPPTLGEFREYCARKTQMPTGEYPRLPDPGLSKERKLAHIAECRRVLGVTKDREPGSDDEPTGHPQR